jgi:hypothetical protein
MNYARFKYLQEFSENKIEKKELEGWLVRTWARVVTDSKDRTPAMGREVRMGSEAQLTLGSEKKGKKSWLDAWMGIWNLNLQPENKEQTSWATN